MLTAKTRKQVYESNMYGPCVGHCKDLWTATGALALKFETLVRLADEAMRIKKETGKDPKIVYTGTYALQAVPTDAHGPELHEQIYRITDIHVKPRNDSKYERSETYHKLEDATELPVEMIEVMHEMDYRRKIQR